ncbi:MAG: FAD-binding oxidoreductase [Bacteroidales bacterium]|nr:FAD-binding oxidoreductase [Bacteroidales bacterium]
MEKHIERVIDTGFVNHDVKFFRLEKPENYDFSPGQATEVSINNSDWSDEKRPFTFTSLPDEEYLEFTIKIYSSHEGVTNELAGIDRGDELILHEVFGAIQYKGKGVFIAGGAGVTPFIAIFRKLHKDGNIDGNKLIFGNKTEKDIILKNEFEKMLGDHFINILSDEDIKPYDHGFIDREYIEKLGVKKDQYFYVCGPPPMMEQVLKALEEIGVDEKYIVKEDL